MRRRAILFRCLAACAVGSLGLVFAAPAPAGVEGFIVLDCATFGENCNREIPDFAKNTLISFVDSSIEVPPSTCDKVVAVGVDLRIDHTWVGDLVVTLENEENGDVTTILERPGVDDPGRFGCPGANVDVRIHDNGGTEGSVNSACAVTIPAIAGERSSASEGIGLGEFTGAACAGTWTLHMRDGAGPNDGHLRGWSLLLLPEATPTRTPRDTPTPGGPPTPTPTQSTAATTVATGATATPSQPADTPTPGGPCAGDCNGDGRVTVAELIRGVRIALEQSPLVNCPSFDTNRNGAVTINELITAVRNALDGCP